MNELVTNELRISNCGLQIGRIGRMAKSGLNPQSAIHNPQSTYATTAVVPPRFVTSHFSVPVLVYTHSTSALLPIRSLAVLNVTVFAAAFPL
jgi:hypothetical protein